MRIKLLKADLSGTKTYLDKLFPNKAIAKFSDAFKFVERKTAKIVALLKVDEALQVSDLFIGTIYFSKVVSID